MTSPIEVADGVVAARPSTLESHFPPSSLRISRFSRILNGSLQRLVSTGMCNVMVDNNIVTDISRLRPCLCRTSQRTTSKSSRLLQTIFRSDKHVYQRFVSENDVPHSFSRFMHCQYGWRMLACGISTLSPTSAIIRETPILRG